MFCFICKCICTLSFAYTLIPYYYGLISYICKSLCKILLEVIYILDTHAHSYKILKYSCILLLLICAVKTDCGARMNDKCLCISDITESVYGIARLSINLNAFSLLPTRSVRIAPYPFVSCSFAISCHVTATKAPDNLPLCQDNCSSIH